MNPIRTETTESNVLLREDESIIYTTEKQELPHFTSVRPVDSEKINQELRKLEIQKILIRDACRKLKFNNEICYKVKDIIISGVFGLFYNSCKTNNHELYLSVFNYFTKIDLSLELLNPTSNSCQHILKIIEDLYRKHLKSDDYCFDSINNLKILQKYGHPFLETSMGELFNTPKQSQIGYTAIKDEINFNDLMFISTYGNQICGVSYLEIDSNNNNNNNDNNSLIQDHLETPPCKKNNSSNHIKNKFRINNNIQNQNKEVKELFLIIKKIIDSIVVFEKIFTQFSNRISVIATRKVNGNYFVNRYEALFKFKQQVNFFKATKTILLSQLSKIQELEKKFPNFSQTVFKGFFSNYIFIIFWGGYLSLNEKTFLEILEDNNFIWMSHLDTSLRDLNRKKITPTVNSSISDFSLLGDSVSPSSFDPIQTTIISVKKKTKKQHKKKVATPETPKTFMDKVGILEQYLNKTSKELIKEIPQEVDYIKTSNEICNDISYQWIILASSAKILRQHNSSFLNKTTIYSIVRSAGILIEQLLTLHLLKSECTHGLIHDHLLMGNKLIELGFNELTKFLDYLSAIRNSNLYSRYFYNYLEKHYEEPPAGLNWLIRDDYIDKNNILEFITKTGQCIDLLIKSDNNAFYNFFQSENTINQSENTNNLINLSLTDESVFLQQQIADSLTLLQKVKELRPHYQEELLNWCDVELHVSLLNECVSQWEYSSEEFLASYTERILTHLQCIDELTEGALLSFLTKGSYRTHDLNEYRTLRQEKIAGDLDEETVNQLNISYGINYFNRYKHIKFSSTSSTKVPDAIKYRINAQIISLQSDGTTMGFTLVKGKNKKLSKAGQYPVLKLTSKVISSLKNRLEWLITRSLNSKDLA